MPSRPLRGLSPEFMRDLKEGLLAPLCRAAITDRDLLLEIREDKVNIYFKGNSLVLLERRKEGYAASLHEKFQRGLQVPRRLSTLADAKSFEALIPDIKKNMLAKERGGSEIEYEQMLIRANNCESHLNTDYFIIDRQSIPDASRERIDLVGIYWPRPRQRGATVPLALFELKFSLNSDIQRLHEQLDRYYEVATSDIHNLAEEAKGVLRQKVELGLIEYKSPEALKSLKISGDINKVRFVVVLVDFNPASKLFNRGFKKLRNLSFANQIDLFYVGMGLWGQPGLSPKI